ncbi:hypothetical protein LAX5112_02547 [Roseibium alexandrii]|uniref:Uncharacterized protein n=1 Tax=Roseibium alexandrii TaxID=388408 RepID=A0A0M7A806_9HYPH|nr:hypothetical protein LAX5112_02547 [Roseibium alexandrii]
MTSRILDDTSSALAPGQATETEMLSILTVGKNCVFSFARPYAPNRTMIAMIRLAAFGCRTRTSMMPRGSIGRAMSSPFTAQRQQIDLQAQQLRSPPVAQRSHR